MYVLSVKNKYNDIGYIDHFVDVNNISKPILSLRNTHMITNVFKGNYIVNNKIDLSFKLRYHIDQVKNIEFRNLDNYGQLSESGYNGEHNVNYTTWTSDISLNWRFAPGSQISIVWKNGIENESNQLINHWTKNLKESFL